MVDGWDHLSLRIFQTRSFNGRKSQVRGSMREGGLGGRGVEAAGACRGG